MDLLRESAFGQIVRYITHNKYFLYPEELPGFQWPELDAVLKQQKATTDTEKTSTESQDGIDGDLRKEENTKPIKDSAFTDIPDPTPSQLASIVHDPAHDLTTVPTHFSNVPQTPTQNSTNPCTREHLDVEQNMVAEETKHIALTPAKTSDGTILVDWYSLDDPANPHNWNMSKKRWVLFQLCMYTLAVYGASSMYVPGEEGVMEEFDVGHTPAALGLAIYVIGYGFGPLLWAPLSEIAVVGRNWVYLPTFFVFVVLSVPTALVRNFAGLLVLRFLTGFFGSPCLANGGASVGDLFSFLELPVYISTYTAACFWGPAIGPIIAGFAVQAKGWRWGLWEIVWFTSPILVLFFFQFPETSADNILRRRAQRLRKLTGRDDLKAQSEIKQAKLSASEVFFDAIVKPMEIMLKDPAIQFTNLYTSLTYGIYYSLFEAFYVYPKIYHFNIGETGLCFLSIGVACLVGVSAFLIYQLKYLIPDIQRNGLRAPEHRLVPALFGVIGLPIGYFVFGWTVREEIHWIVGLIAVTVLVACNFLIFQSVFIYLPLSYPKYAASLFASNDLARSLFAAACILFARPMFLGLGVGGGTSVLAGLSLLGIGGMFGLWKFGAKLRARSTFSTYGE